MKYIVGLGNPGLKYKYTRHNVGFRVIDLLKKKYSISLRSTDFDAQTGTGSIEGHKIMLIKPMTFMNQSGYAVDGIMRYYKAPLEDLLVICDDIDIPFGTLRIRAKGSAGTHNGMRSVEEYLGSGDFPRLRIGIGKPAGELIPFVLGKFESAQKDDLEKLLERACEACETIVTKGIGSAQSKFNGSALAQEE